MQFAHALGAVAVATVCTGAAPCAHAEDAVQTLRVAGAELHLSLGGEEFRDGAGPLVDWARRSASIVGGYYGRFPVPGLSVRIRAVAGGGVHGGRAESGGEPLIRVQVGREVTAAELRDDWVLVHEMTHLALPEMDDNHAWLSEGLATYVEGVARTQAANMTAGELWQEYATAMPKGMPDQDDRGLDHTHTWARTYWGGALWCLIADVTIRERTANRFGLQDALRAIARDSGGLRSHWQIERILAVGDAATGVTVLGELYAQMRDAAAAPDLPGLWRRLGVAEADGTLHLAHGTAEAAVREAITQPRP